MNMHLTNSRSKVKGHMSLFYDFYARQQNASRVLFMTWASVRLSVCHTLQLYQNGKS